MCIIHSSPFLYAHSFSFLCCSPPNYVLLLSPFLARIAKGFLRASVEQHPVVSQKISSTPRSLIFEQHSLTSSSTGFSKFPNKVAQSLDSKIRGTKVVFKVLNSTTRSAIGEAKSKMLEQMCELGGVLNLSQLESLDD